MAPRFPGDLGTSLTANMTESFDDLNKKRRLDEDGTAASFAESPAEGRKEKLERWLKPLNSEQLVKLLVDMYDCLPWFKYFCMVTSKLYVVPYTLSLAIFSVDQGCCR